MVQRPLISSDRETGRSHTPLLAALISGSSPSPIRKQQLGLHAPGLTFLCLSEAEELVRAQILQAPPPVGSLDFTWGNGEPWRAK
jgi:hypothetical protein